MNRSSISLNEIKKTSLKGIRYLPQIVPVYTSLNFNHYSVLYLVVVDVITYIDFKAIRYLPQIIPVYTSLNFNRYSVLYLVVVDVITYIDFDVAGI